MVLFQINQVISRMSEIVLLKKQIVKVTGQADDEIKWNLRHFRRRFIY